MPLKRDMGISRLIFMNGTLYYSGFQGKNTGMKNMGTGSGQGIQVAIATDQRYADYAFIAIYSMLHWHPSVPENGDTVHLLFEHLSPVTLEKFKNMVQKHGWHLNLLPMQDSFFKDWPVMRWSR